MRHLICILLLVIHFSDVKSQSIEFKEEIEFKGLPYSIENTSFKIGSIINQLDPPDSIGTIYYGEKKEAASMVLSPKLERQFYQFFKNALVKDELGEKELNIVFKSLEISENINDTINYKELQKSSIEKGGSPFINKSEWRKRSYKILVDYVVDNQLIYSDSSSVDSTATLKDYSLSHFVSGFFRASLEDVNQEIINYLSEQEADSTKEVQIVLSPDEGGYFDLTTPRDTLSKKIKIKIKKDNSIRFRGIEYIDNRYQESVTTSYANREPGYYKLKIKYFDEEGEYEFIQIDEVHFVTISEYNTITIFCSVLLAGVSFYSAYYAAQQNLNDTGPP